jgi:flagellar motor switch protein FliN/FliY
MEFTNLTQSEIDELTTARKGLSQPDGRATVRPLLRHVADGEVDPNGAKPDSPSITPAMFEELGPDKTVNVPVAGMEVLMDVPLSVSVELGRARCFVKDLLSLTAGSIVELDRTAGDPVDILINGRPFALGEVVVIDENFGVRIREIIHKKADKDSRKAD